MLKFIRRRLRQRRERLACDRITRSGFFDSRFYLESNPDVSQSGQDPLLHFLRNGAREGRSPSERFDVRAYLDANPAAAQSGVNPVLDWLDVGAKGGRVWPGDAMISSNTIDEKKKNHGKQRNKEVDPRLRQQAIDVGVFDEKFYLSHYPDVNFAQADPFVHYMANGASEFRNPSPNFDTHFYETTHRHLLHGHAPGRALAHYLKSGRAVGLPTRPPGSMTIIPDKTGKAPDLRIAVHLHLFYPEMAEHFAAYLTNPGFSFDLFVTAQSEIDAEFVRRIFARALPDVRVTVCAVANRGRDIAPFLLAFPEIWSRYDYVLHLHSKKSLHAGFGTRWLDWIMRHLLGDPAIAAACLRKLVERPQCAMLFPQNYQEIKKFAGWGNNEARIQALLARLGAPLGTLPRYAHFAAGSMAWYKVEAFAPLVAALTLDDFEIEEGQVEGTLAHLLERAMSLYAEQRGYHACTYYLRKLPPAREAEVNHGRPSSAEPVSLKWMRDTPAIAFNAPKSLAPSRMLHNPRALNISWIIPDFSLGAGGHMTIFRMVEMLDRFGHRQTIWIQNARNYPDTEAAKATIRKHYSNIGEHVSVRFLPDDMRQLSGDALIATDCWTAFPAASARNFKERFYFIQDYEPYFHPHGENQLVAESTYRMGFAALCAGDWLLRKALAHGMWARKWELASDPEFYFPGVTRTAAGRGDRKARIVFYCRGITPRRAVNLGLAAFAELGRRRSDFEVLMFGEPPTERALSFPHRQLGILKPEQLGELYRGADIGVCFSTTNYSLVPLEMMACSVPVVEIDTESTRTAFPLGSVSLAMPDAQSVADALEKMLDDADARASQVAAAENFIRKLDWESSARAVEAAILERLVAVGSRPIDPIKLSAPVSRKKRKVSVIIPTYNGGALFRDVLGRVVAQNTDFDYDVLVVDSSSTDGTAEFVCKLGGRARLHSIPQSEFQHGRTRNLAIAQTEGEIVAVLTQDATPADEHWLARLVGGFALGPGIAGAIGRHRAYPGHNRILARDLDRMFDRFADLGPIFNLDRGLPSFLPRGGLDWQMLMHFYSDNNSAMRRSVWRQLPYPEVDWGEDQIWAWDALKLGFSKVYVDDAVVLHSHDSPPAQQLQVAISEGQLFAEHFGYDLHPGGLDPASFAEFERQQQLAATRAGLPQAALTAYLASARLSIEGRTLGAEAAAPL